MSKKSYSSDLSRTDGMIITKFLRNESLWRIIKTLVKIRLWSNEKYLNIIK